MCIHKTMSIIFACEFLVKNKIEFQLGKRVLLEFQFNYHEHIFRKASNV